MGNHLRHVLIYKYHNIYNVYVNTLSVIIIPTGLINPKREEGSYN